VEVKDLLKIYSEDSIIRTSIDSIKTNPITQIKGLSGSLDAVLASVNYHVNPQHNLFILNDKEDAAYFYNDLQNLLGEENVFLFPMSYKKPYQYEEIDNANVLQRAEILNQLNNEKANLLIVTYPEALSEKVINKKSLIANTLQRLAKSLTSTLYQSCLSLMISKKPTLFMSQGSFLSVGVLLIFSLMPLNTHTELNFLEMR